MRIKNHYFFIGTEAEFIKLLPIFREFERTKTQYKIIASGQNDIKHSTLFSLLNKKEVDIILFQGSIRQTAPGLFLWFFKTLFQSIPRLGSEFRGLNKSNTRMVIHGDTISTVMGALIGKYYRLEIVHVEAGLRSYNLFHPFPEEIDRVVASRFVDIHFCPNKWALDNLKNKKGVKINTYQNTLLDSLNLVLAIKNTSPVLEKLANRKFFLFIMHRQENLFNQTLVETLIGEIEENAKKLQCVFVMHKPTILVLEKKKILQKLKTNKNILLTERLSYIEFMKLLNACEYIITDGGSNQEESYYFGKPCLILRSTTERIEGLDENVVLSKNNIETIKNFTTHVNKYKRKRVSAKVSPGKIIVNYLLNK